MHSLKHEAFGSRFATLMDMCSTMSASQLVSSAAVSFSGYLKDPDDILGSRLTRKRDRREIEKAITSIVRKHLVILRDHPALTRCTLTRLSPPFPGIAMHKVFYTSNPIIALVAAPDEITESTRECN
jgi:hypothetical protein